jgi:hypothetical protein
MTGRATEERVSERENDGETSERVNGRQREEKKKKERGRGRASARYERKKNEGEEKK